MGRPTQSACQFEGRDELTNLGRAQPGNAFKMFGVEFRSVAIEKVPASLGQSFQRRLAAPGSEKQLDEVEVAQPLGTVGQEFFTGSEDTGGRKVVEARHAP
jgi:hypothetical protein